MLSPGRLVGVLAAAAHAVFWAAFIASPPEGSTRGTTLLGATMVLAGAIAMAVAWRGAHLAMYLLFFVMFVPLGLYLSMTPAYGIIGWIHLAYLAGAVLVHREMMTANKTKKNGSAIQ
jgi:hypothetical protein